MMNSLKSDSETELTSTMGNVLSATNKDEKTDTNDATPTSSTDAANTASTASRIVSDDPISSTSSDISAETKTAELNQSVADLLEMNIPSEKITEDVEDLVHDLESLLGETTDSFISLPSRTPSRADISSSETCTASKSTEQCEDDKTLTRINKVSSVVEETQPAILLEVGETSVTKSLNRDESKEEVLKENLPKADKDRDLSTVKVNKAEVAAESDKKDVEESSGQLDTDENIVNVTEVEKIDSAVKNEVECSENRKKQGTIDAELNISESIEEISVENKTESNPDEKCPEKEEEHALLIAETSNEKTTEITLDLDSDTVIDGSSAQPEALQDSVAEIKQDETEISTTDEQTPSESADNPPHDNTVEMSEELTKTENNKDLPAEAEPSLRPQTVEEVAEVAALDISNTISPAVDSTGPQDIKTESTSTVDDPKLKSESPEEEYQHVEPECGEPSSSSEVAESPNDVIAEAKTIVECSSVDETTTGDVNIAQVVTEEVQDKIAEEAAKEAEVEVKSPDDERPEESTVQELDETVKSEAGLLESIAEANESLKITTDSEGGAVEELLIAENGGSVEETKKVLIHVEPETTIVESDTVENDVLPAPVQEVAPPEEITPAEEHLPSACESVEASADSVTVDDSASVEDDILQAPVQEEAPPKEITPAEEHLPSACESVEASAGYVTVDESASVEDDVLQAPVQDVAPPEEDPPAEEHLPSACESVEASADSVSVYDSAAVEDDVLQAPVQDVAPPEEDPPAEEHLPSACESVKASAESITVDESAAVEGDILPAPVQEVAPPEEVTPAKDESGAVEDDVLPAPVQEVAPPEEVTPIKDESGAVEDDVLQAPVQEVAPPEEDTPAEEQLPSACESVEASAETVKIDESAAIEDDDLQAPLQEVASPGEDPPGEKNLPSACETIEASAETVKIDESAAVEDDVFQATVQEETQPEEDIPAEEHTVLDDIIKEEDEKVLEQKDCQETGEKDDVDTAKEAEEAECSQTKEADIVTQEVSESLETGGAPLVVNSLEEASQEAATKVIFKSLDVSQDETVTEESTVESKKPEPEILSENREEEEVSDTLPQLDDIHVETANIKENKTCVNHQEVDEALQCSEMKLKDTVVDFGKKQQACDDENKQPTLASIEPPQESQNIKEPIKMNQLEFAPLILSEDDSEDEVVPTLTLKPNNVVIPTPQDDLEEESNLKDSREESPEVIPQIEDILADQPSVMMEESTRRDMQENLETILAVASLQKIDMPVESGPEQTLTEKERTEMEALRRAVESITDTTASSYVDEEEVMNAQMTERDIYVPVQEPELVPVEDAQVVTTSDLTVIQDNQQSNDEEQKFPVVSMLVEENKPKETVLEESVAIAVPVEESRTNCPNVDESVSYQPSVGQNLSTSVEKKVKITLRDVDEVLEESVLDKSMENVDAQEENDCEKVAVEAEVNAGGTSDLLVMGKVKDVPIIQEVEKPQERDASQSLAEAKPSQLKVGVEEALPEQETVVDSSEVAADNTITSTPTKEKTKPSERSKRHKKSDNKLEELSINVDVPDREKPYSPKITIKPIKVPDEEVSTTSGNASESEFTKGSLKMTITKQSDKMHSVLKVCDVETSSESMTEVEEPIPKLIIKPKQIEQQQHSPKMSTRSSKQIYSPTSSTQRSQSPRITIKPVVKPEKQDVVSPLKIKIGLEPSKKQPMISPRITIKPIPKPEADLVDEKERSSPKIIIKPVVRSQDTEQQAEEVEEVKERIVLKINKGNLPTPVKESKKREHPPLDEEKSEKLAKITVKFSKGGGHPHIVQQLEESHKRSHDMDNVQERSKKQKLEVEANISTRSRHSKDTDSTVRSLTHDTFSDNAMTCEATRSKHKDLLESPVESKRARLRDETPRRSLSRSRQTTVDGVEDVVESKLVNSPIVISEDSRSQDGGNVIVVEDAVKEEVPPAGYGVGVVESTRSITPKQEVAVAAMPMTPTPRKRGRPRKVPIEVREEFVEPDDIKPKLDEGLALAAPPQQAQDTGRPKRSCRGLSVCDRLGIKPRKPRGPGRGRGSKRGMGVRPMPEKEPKLSKAKLKLLQKVLQGDTKKVLQGDTQKVLQENQLLDARDQSDDDVIIIEPSPERELAPNIELENKELACKSPIAEAYKSPVKEEPALHTDESVVVKSLLEVEGARVAEAQQSLVEASSTVDLTKDCTTVEAVPSTENCHPVVEKASLQDSNPFAGEETSLEVKKELLQPVKLKEELVSEKPEAESSFKLEENAVDLCKNVVVDVEAEIPFSVLAPPGSTSDEAFPTLEQGMPVSTQPLAASAQQSPLPDRPLAAIQSLPSEVVMVDEETQMSADTNSSRAQTPAKQIAAPADITIIEESQSSVHSTATTESGRTPSSSRPSKAPRLEVQDTDHTVGHGGVELLSEYYWNGQGPCMIQEQVAHYLGIKSFKRKYPNLARRIVDMQERDFIRERGLASEGMCDLGLTAVSSADILDIMYSDFQDKYEEYCKHQRDRQAKEMIDKQRALNLAASQEKSKADLTEQAVMSAAQWNARFNKTRKEQRRACMDLQTLTVNYPKGRMKQSQRASVGNYPVALVPGQFTDYYEEFTAAEISNLPINTIGFGPAPFTARDDSEHSGSDGSDSESDSSATSSSGSDSDSSSGVDDCKLCKHSPKRAGLLTPK